ncbi:SMI1/KNR4 family protein [Streptomyces sp. A7024]|uniref:SMI1/KNR4 family protein n=1 Tax=Streptomyces coryli TaxID=1128680 RepID=A0A6G4TXN1_9ACTN|nr:SMI1/KNR4 family protein [Streptomyces coryli]NGN63761.1 SMI1/KNR4 family protein [Streptomyces coryli]
MGGFWRRRRSLPTDDGASGRLAVWPERWGELGPDERIAAVASAIVDGITAIPGQVRGLSEETIREIERDQPAPLCEAYRCFLSLLGGGAGRLFQGTDVFYPDVMGLREGALELLEENGFPFELQETDRVFYMHQGYLFWFLRGTGPDPEVWGYGEGQHENQPILDSDRFTDWVRAMAEQEKAAWARLSVTDEL